MTLDDKLRSHARTLRRPEDLDPLMDRIGDARFVLLGEASHGTSQYHTWRTAITQRLIAEKGFAFVAVEADEPDGQRISRYVQGFPNSGSCARDVLHRVRGWPTWPWANHEVVELVGWLYDQRRRTGPVGFHGLDGYNLGETLAFVTRFLEVHAPEALPAARSAFSCFDLVRVGGFDRYAWRTRALPETCEPEIVRLLARLHDHGQDPNAERYYRTLLRGGPEAWNVRERHLAETLERLTNQYGPGARGVVWAHDSHVGDARQTDMSAEGMVNLGQLVRERHGDDVVVVGFGSYAGSVAAAPAWGEPMERMELLPAREGSWEAVLHRALGEDSLLLFGDTEDPELLRPRAHRAIGVVYGPEAGRASYVPTVLPARYDAVLYLDHTDALHPLREVESSPA